MINKVFFIFLLSIWLNPCLFAKDTLEESFVKATLLLKEGNYKKSEPIFKKTLKENFGHYPSYFNLSLSYLYQKNYKLAATILEDTKPFNPFDIRIDKMLSCAYLALGKNEEAKKYIAAIIFKKADEIFAHKKMGIIYLLESNFDAAQAEFTMLKNLAPQDTDNSMFLELTQTIDKSSVSGLNKIRELKEKVIIEEINSLTPIEDFAQPEISKRIAEKLKQEKITPQANPQTTGKNQKKKLPYGLKGTLEQTVEFYDRTPLATSPINGWQTLSNLKVQGKTKQGTDFSSQWEWFNNRWDHTQLDYYKINISKSNKYEIEIGKFSPKHFPTLVSHPTVVDGITIWNKFSLPQFKAQDMTLPENTNGEGLNLGEMYRDASIDNRPFNNTEITLVAGRTLDPINLDSRKEKNEYTYETSGQFEQWTQAFRAYTQLTSYANIGTSAAITQDRMSTATVSSTTNPLRSKAIGVDGDLKLLDNKLACNWELAHSNYDSDIDDASEKNKSDEAWYFKSEYTPQKEYSFAYEQKVIGKNFKVEGAYQTEDKLSRTITTKYTAANPKAWRIKSVNMKFMPEETNYTGNFDSRKTYKTFQPVTSFQLPQNAKLTVDYKYYRELDKCNCSNYRTRTVKTDLDWEIKNTKTTVKPSYTFERKDDRIDSATDEKMKEMVMILENTAIKNITLKLSAEREIKTYIGATTKSYKQYVYSWETKYSVIPSRLDLNIKLSRDKKNPSDTNETDVTTITSGLDYTSKDRSHKLSLKIERKNNIYLPWSDTSAYRQNYAKLKYTHNF